VSQLLWQPGDRRLRSPIAPGEAPAGPAIQAAVTRVDAPAETLARPQVGAIRCCGAACPIIRIPQSTAFVSGMFSIV